MDDKNWMMEALKHLSRIGRTGQDGSNRLAFTKEDAEARAYFKGLMTESGLAVREDAFGNIIGRLEGSEPGLAAVATGSHLDTVPNGGHYDGMAGCAASLAAVRSLRRRGTLRRPLEVIVFQMEESSRFSLATFGSKVMAGKADLDLARRAKDKEGISLPDAMRAQGYDFEALPRAGRKKGELACFVEMHIEQSPILEEKGLPVGIVTAIAAPIRSRVEITGKASHSGSTVMNNRLDALVTAADLVLAVRAVGNRFSRREIVATVGNLVVRPGAMNVVPGGAELWIDLRGTSREAMDEAQAAILKAAEGLAAKHGMPVVFHPLGADDPVRMTPGIVDLMGEASRDLRIPSTPIVSGAGHDTMNMAALGEVGMIFVRNRDGLSHHHEEYAAPEDLMSGLDLLTETLYRLAMRAEGS
ncbi:MAG: Zn-dependent hydrolase [Deltaproteobacteria bacterium]|jgi:N-carbamoyl-L-amino-acid hydrolase|nr:Zn-dependent hydrolase [Deltaproteobacteria bacterium]